MKGLLQRVPYIPDSLSIRLNWDPPLSPPQASVAPPWTQGGGSLTCRGGVLAVKAAKLKFGADEKMEVFFLTSKKFTFS